MKIGLFGHGFHGLSRILERGREEALNFEL
jgi:hypothetical protein